MTDWGSNQDPSYLGTSVWDCWACRLKSRRMLWSFCLQLPIYPEQPQGSGEPCAAFAGGEWGTPGGRCSQVHQSAVSQVRGDSSSSFDTHVQSQL